MYKFYVFSPRDNDLIAKIIEVASNAGAGEVGNYTHCAFITEGKGTWYPLAGSNPTIGNIGELSTEDEVKIEMECKKEDIVEILRAIKSVHPYEKISIDAIEIERFE